MTDAKKRHGVPTWLATGIILVVVGVIAYFGYQYWVALLPEVPPPPN